MGWLFAVARGLQAGRRGAVLQALVPIALGHEASIVLLVALVSAVQIAGGPTSLRVGGSLALLGFGLFKVLRPNAHLRWVGMRLSHAELALWSFLMSSAHGAGLMLVPVLLRLPADGHADHTHGLEAVPGSVTQGVAASLIHTAAMLLTMAVLALVVYEKLGVGVLRRAWVNLDLIWAAAIIGGGLVTLFS
jgi:hypothetical protein